MLTAPSLAAFVITYHRADGLAGTLDRLLAQSRPPQRILVVDNGAERETRRVAEAAGPAVDYTPMTSNLGPAAGAAAGLEILTAAGFDWIYWGDDDDPPWRPDLLQDLLALAAADASPQTLGGVAATGLHWSWRDGRPRRVADAELPGAVEVDVVGGGGQLLLHRAAVAAAGLPDRRLFWGHEDWEYCLRVRRAGFRLLADGDSMLARRQESGRTGYRPHRSPVPARERRCLPRDYYSTRNYVFMMRSTFRRPDLARRRAGRALLRMLASWWRGPRFAIAFIRWQGRALWDAYRGHMGVTVSLEGSQPAAGHRGIGVSWGRRRRRWLRRLYAAVRAVDRADLPLVRHLPSRWKLRTVRRLFGVTGGAASSGAPDAVEAAPVVVDGFPMVMPASLRQTYVLQDHEPGSRRLMRRFLESGMGVVDVGANIGYQTVLAASLVGPEGRVWAVEPSRANLGYLRRNLELNGLGNVTVLEHAAGTARRRRRFHLRSDAGHHGFYGHPSEGTVEVVEVEEVPLDAVIEGRVDLVKLDVEAGEMDALRGMRGILRSHPDVRVLVEWNPPMLSAAGFDPRELPQWLRDEGFRLFVVDESAEGRGQRPLLRPFDAGELDAGTEHNLWAERAETR